MAYFSQLHLQKEPFSNSPDPEMFFQSLQHQGCLQKLELAIRLQRGLSVVIGDIGTGKSTLCRQLIQRISHNNHQILTHLILDPEFTSPCEFLTLISKTLGLDPQLAAGSEWQLKDAIKAYLFEQAVHQHKVPVLIIDEGQKLPGFCVEILREFLNFETNQHKLLQIVIFGQEEFRAMLRQKPNFADRITTYQRLKPLNFRDTRAMIAFRIRKSHTDPGPPPKLFSLAAIVTIYWLTRGYPRRIVMLCSKVIISILINQQREAGVIQVLRAARETAIHGRGRISQLLHVVTATALVVIAVTLLRPFWPDASQLARVKQALLPSPPLHAVTPQPTAPLPPTPAKSAPSVPETRPIRTQAKAAPSPATGSATLTATLGTLLVEPGVPLSKMVARVYGRFTNKKLAMVLAANPRLTDPDQVAPRTTITFPLLPSTEPPPPPGAFRLELARTPTLATAYDLVKEYPESAPPLLIKPLMSAGEGLRFLLVLEETFRDEGSARAALALLPSLWQARAKVLSEDQP
jgi:type II secretory pathway predicted ATPase ExeA